MQPLTVSKRTPKRSRVFVSAEVDWGAGPVPSHVRDISRSGALVEAEAAPAAGTILRLKCGATTVDGRVAWSERGWFGVEFETPLLASEVVDPAGAKLAVSAPRSYRAGDVLE